MISNRVENWESIIGAVAILVAFNPYIVWHFPIDATGIASGIIFVLNLLHFKTYRQSFLAMMVIITLYIYMAVYSDLSIMGLIALLMICPIFFTSKKFLNDVYGKFVTLYSVLIFISLIVFLLVAFLDIRLPYYQIEPLNEEKKYITYYAYPFLVYVENGSFLNFRFHGIFDEPGVVGTISGVVMLIERFNLKKYRNIPIFLSGIFSLSLYFFLILFIFVLLKSKLSVKIVALFLIIFLYDLLSQNEVLDSLLFSRFELSDSGGFAGDTRDHMSESWYKNFCNSPSFYFGLGGGSHAVYNYGGASYKDLIVDYGIVFMVMYALSFFWAALSLLKKRIDVVLYLVIIGSVIYQRPFINNIGYVFLIFVPLYVWSISPVNEYSYERK